MIVRSEDSDGRFRLNNMFSLETDDRLTIKNSLRSQTRIYY